MTPIKLAARLVLLGIIAFAQFFALEMYHFTFNPLLSKRASFEFEVKPGQTMKQITRQLDENSVLKHSQFFMLMARYRKITTHIKAGEYAIDSDTTAKELLRKLVKADVIMRQITLLEGWTVKQVLQELHESPYLKHDLKNLSMDALQKKLKLERFPEGLFFPETYTFAKNTEESDILMLAQELMQKRLSKAWSGRDKDLVYKSSYEALIVASMVEREAALAEEREIIAGVILRRIKKGMYLQIDPTVIYALGDKYTGKIMKSDLKLKSPYNTYTKRGLPPTPIANPGEASIIAAMHPDSSNALYFVAKGDGSHIFSATLEDHNKAVKSEK